MNGIKKHTHADRERIIEEMIPLVKQKFGDNLIALAASGSYARNEDTDYSDLELIAIVKEMPRGKEMGGFAKIYDGMLVEMIWMTEKTYIHETLDIDSAEHWYISASDVILPLINKECIDRLNRHRVDNLDNKCAERAVGQFAEYHEGTTKLLNAIDQENRDGIPLSLFEMTLQALKMLSYLNKTPYVTFSRFITESRQFSVKPASFTGLIDIVMEGSYTDLSSLRETVVAVFTEFEEIFENLGCSVYDDNFDPNKPTMRHRHL